MADLAIILAITAIANVIGVGVKDAFVTKASECWSDSPFMPDTVIDVVDVEFWLVEFEVSYGQDLYTQQCRRHFFLLFDNHI